MCYNSTSPFLFLQTYSSLIIGYIQKRVTISSKKVDGFFKKGRPFWAKRSTFFKETVNLFEEIVTLILNISNYETVVSLEK